MDVLRREILQIEKNLEAVMGCDNRWNKLQFYGRHFRFRDLPDDDLLEDK